MVLKKLTNYMRHFKMEYILGMLFIIQFLID